MTTEKEKPTIAVDFDGVLNSNEQGYHEGRITDLPVQGAVQWVWDMVGDFDVVVFTCRASTDDGYFQVCCWLAEHGFPTVKVTDKKPVAEWYLDDRAIRFEGYFPTRGRLEALKTRWNRR